jgi:hypothetical protein
MGGHEVANHTMWLALNHWRANCVFRPIVTGDFGMIVTADFGGS